MDKEERLGFKLERGSRRILPSYRSRLPGEYSSDITRNRSTQELFHKVEAEATQVRLHINTK